MNKISRWQPAMRQFLIRINSFSSTHLTLKRLNAQKIMMSSWLERSTAYYHLPTRIPNSNISVTSFIILHERLSYWIFLTALYHEL